MMSNRLTTYYDDVQQALSSFLETLLGESAPLEIDEPEQADASSLQDDAADFVVLRASPDASPPFAVRLHVDWIPLLSEAMLGEPMQIDEPGADDLAREIAAQGYGAVRTQLSAEVKLPDVPFEVHLPGAPPSLPDRLWSIPFRLTAPDQTLEGIALLPLSAALPDDFADASQPEANPQPATQAQQSQPSVDVAAASFPDLGGEHMTETEEQHRFDLLGEVELEVKVELGRRRLPLSDVMRLTTGSVIELEKLVGEPLEIYANDRFIAEGEAVVIDEQFGIRITSLVSKRQRNKAFL